MVLTKMVIMSMLLRCSRGGGVWGEGRATHNHTSSRIGAVGGHSTRRVGGTLVHLLPHLTDLEDEAVLGGEDV